MSEPVRLRANAKLNLFLRVIGRRHDGFHDIETIFHGIALADLVEMTPGPPGTVEVEMRAPDHARAHLPTPESNIVNLAASQLARVAEGSPGASIVVTKKIPIGAGMAGGSADAAATLVGLNALWQLGLTHAQLLDEAAALGSDVPYCIDGGTVLATGRGSEMSPVTEAPAMWFVLGIGQRPLMTRAAYDAWDRLGVPGPAAGAREMVEALGQHDLGAIAAFLHNDLYAPALSQCPDIETGCRALLDAGAVGAGMTGSGPTVFGLAGSETHAHTVAETVRGRFHQVEVVTTARRGVERL
jgi:4-diphosphocytidyl-2-C-methyl-D-erythritol kinase